MDRFCRFCGNKLKETSAFCRKCGKQVTEGAESGKSSDTGKAETGGNISTANATADGNINSVNPVKIQPSSQEDTKFCKSCGKKIRAGAEFCNYCGFKTKKKKVQTPGPANVNSPVNSRGNYAHEGNSGNFYSNPGYIQNTKQYKKFVLPVVAAVLALVILAGFIYRGFVRTKIISDNSENVRILDENVPEIKPLGNSKAFSIEPREGMKISAEENAMDKDREPVFKEVSDEDYLKLNNLAYSNDIIMIDAYDFSIGLDEDEVIPGQYTVEYDLSVSETDETIWPFLTAFRVLEDGTMEPYAMELDGSVMRYRSNRNCSFIVGVLLVVGAEKLGSKLLETSGHFMFKDDFCTDFTDDRHAMVVWSVSDFSKYSDSYSKYYMAANEKRVELERQYLEKAKELYPEATDIFRTTNLEKRNQDIAKYVISRMKTDPEYQRYRKMAVEAYPFPIRAVIKQYETVWKYLAGEEQHAKMPSGCVTVQFKPGSEEADTKKAHEFRNPVITMYIDKLYENINDPANDLELVKKRETRVLTMLLHEMFHACQYEYFFYNYLVVETYNTLLMESTATVVETEGFKYFQKQGLTPGYENASLEEALDSEKGCLTCRKYPQYFGIELDKPPSEFGTNPGYQWAEFFDYLNEKKGRIAMADIWKHYSARMNFSTAVMSGYKLSPAEFTKLEWDFLSDKSVKNVSEEIESGTYQQADGLSYAHSFKNTDTNPYNFSLSSLGGYVRAHIFTTNDKTKKYGLLLMDTITEEDLRTDDKSSYYKLIPVNRGILMGKRVKGRSLDEGVEVIDESKNFIYVDPEYLYYEFAVLEQKAWNSSETKTSFKALLMRQPDPPKYELDEYRRNVIVYKPEITEDSIFMNAEFKALMKKVGFMLRATRKDGKIYECFIPLESFPKENPSVKIPLTDIVQGVNADDFEKDIKMQIAEAFTVEDGDKAKIYKGPLSETKNDNMLALYGEWDITYYLRNMHGITDGLIGMMDNALSYAGDDTSREVTDSMKKYIDQYSSVQKDAKAAGAQGTSAKLIIRPAQAGTDIEYEAVLSFESSTGQAPMLLDGVYDEIEKKLYLTQQDLSLVGSNGEIYDYKDYNLLSSITLSINEDKKTLVCTGDMVVNSKIISYNADVEGKKISDSYDDFDRLKG